MTNCGGDTYCCATGSSPNSQCNCAADPLVTVTAGIAQAIIGVVGLPYTATTPGPSAPSSTSAAGTTAPQRPSSSTSGAKASASASAKMGGGKHSSALRIALPIVLVCVAAAAVLAFFFLCRPWIQQRRKTDPVVDGTSWGPRAHINDSEVHLRGMTMNPYLVPRPPGDGTDGEAAEGFGRPDPGAGPAGVESNPYTNGAPSRSGMLGGIGGGEEV
jgi:hypothetical protein